MIGAGQVQAWSMVEVDYSNVERSLRAVGPAWRSRLGFPLTHLPYVLRAVALGLASFPRLNGEGADPGLPGIARIDLSVQSSQVERSPVLRDARERGVAEIAIEVQRLQGAALSGSLGEEAFAQATFEVVDHVGHGAVIGTPRVGGSMIAALAVHQVAPQPSVVAIDEHSHGLGIRPKGALVLSWGSTSVDAGDAAGFLCRVKELLEQTQWEISAPG